MRAQFYDPSLEPIVTTDIDGNILYVKIEGLHHYGFNDIILESNFNIYQELFEAIMSKIYVLDFSVDMTLNYHGATIEFEVDDSGLAHMIVSSIIENASIIAHSNPITGLTSHYTTKGLVELYNHPEVEIDGEDEFAIELLSYVINTVKFEDTVHNEEYTIYHEDQEYFVDTKLDRSGCKIPILSRTCGLKTRKLIDFGKGKSGCTGRQMMKRLKLL